MRRFTQQVAAECAESQSWSSEEAASVLLSVMKLRASLHKQQLKGVFSHRTLLFTDSEKITGYYRDYNIHFFNDMV